MTSIEQKGLSMVQHMRALRNIDRTYDEEHLRVMWKMQLQERKQAHKEKQHAKKVHLKAEILLREEDTQLRRVALC